MKGFIIKEFYHIFRDVRTMVILFGMPVVQVLIFGFAISTEIKDAKIAILDYSRDNMSLELSNKIISSDYFILSEILEDENQIETVFKAGKIKEVIIFGDNFARNLQKEQNASIQIIADASDPNTANLLVNYTTGIIRNYMTEKMGKQSMPIEINTEYKMLFNPEIKSVFMFVPGIITILLMLVSAMMTSISIAREKELGTMEVLLVSPLKPIQIVVGKVIPYVVLSFVNAITILLLAFFVFGMPVQGSVILLLAESLLFIIMALALGVFISTVSNSQQTAMMISMFALMLPTILLSGFIFPIENMPEVLQWLCNLMPTKWFIIIVKDIMLKGVGLAHIWQETFIITGMTALFIGLSVRKFKIRLE
ncbi:MAG: ABC transporter permease [Bacteroidetes bacterium]|nr:MAG: ABC transporter permease [Bacteroidota bacterium]RLD77149.1 MAG: ABC transporter permease [Bacteroidota bacterium]